MRTSARYIEGAIFSLPFYAPLATGAGRRFADSYAALNGGPPDVFSAFAFDAFTFVHNAVERGARTRDALGTALAQLGEVETTTAAGGFNANREPIHATRVYVVTHGALVPLP
ncbi:MAG: ABC transporter substrate-binding protein [Sandaracinaceae bacterium]|nr:ABC transporter substrate-binding protein [Sandaracinaceae bacterium]